MKICGLKLTHDGAIALINNGKLEFCVEMEKLNNNPRFKSIEDSSTIAEVLKFQGYSIKDIDLFAIDGWGGTDQDSLAIQPGLEIAEKNNFLSVLCDGSNKKIAVAPYREKLLTDDILEEWQFNSFSIQENKITYNSYLHAASHLFGTYCTSPFAKDKESSYMLIWDGGMYPRLYYIDPKKQTIDNLGPIFLLIGNIYTIFSQHFGPFKVQGSFAKDNLSVAGKVMAYIALGKELKELYPIFDNIYRNNYDKPMGFANVFANKFNAQAKGKSYLDEDILYTFHLYLEKLLIEKLNKKITRDNKRSMNLCIAGGCALNIKWNSAIRNTKLFNNVYVSPFPNDSGSALGAACCAMVKHTGNYYLDWNVYSGPNIIVNEPAEGWKSIECTLNDLAKILHEQDEPVVFLNDKAELGPRALGNRSIIASPKSTKMKDILNFIKQREYYRPVSPICIEEEASRIFNPGSKDPFMLFDHLVRDEWQSKIPAIMHLDQTARLQTLSEKDNPIVFKLLVEYYKLSGVPLLCNTSANFNGKGFFCDVKSATSWNMTNYVFCNNILYEKVKKIDYSNIHI